MAALEQVKELVNRMPDPDSRGMFTEGIDKQRIEEAVAALWAGGRSYVAALIDMLGPPGSDQEVKPRYALHCLANHVLINKDESARRSLCETIAAALEGDRPNHVRQFLCQELQWAGRGEAAPALGKLLLDEELTEPAAMALVAIGDGAAEQLRAALPRAGGKCRLNVIQALGELADTGCAPELTKALSDPDREVRLAAGWALARAGQASAAEPLIKAADNARGWERIQATKHCLLLAEKLKAAGHRAAAAKICNHLRQTRNNPDEQYLRQAAVRVLL